MNFQRDKMTDLKNADIKSLNNLTRLYSSYGKDKRAWSDLIVSLNESQSKANINVTSFFVKKILDEPRNALTLDIIDFLYDYGPMNIIEQLSTTTFMTNILNLIKNEDKSGPLIIQKAVYLTKKWNEKIKKYPKNKGKFAGVIYNFSEIKKMGIKIPDSGYNCLTYDHYISDVDENFEGNNKDNLNDNENKMLYPNYDERNNGKEIDNYRQFEYNGISPIGENFKNNEVMTPFGSNNRPGNQNVNSIYNINNDNHNGKELSNNINLNDFNSNNNIISNNNNYTINNNFDDSLYFNSNDPILYKNTWTTRLTIYNKWIDEGKLGYNSEKLKEGIQNILKENDRIENMIKENKSNKNNNILDILTKVKSDMDQTCIRYDNLMKDKKIEEYKSAFEGNNKKYKYKKQEDNKYWKGIQFLGEKMKQGFASVENSVINAGKTLKDSTIKGYNFVKDKISNNDKEKENKEDKNHKDILN